MAESESGSDDLGPVHSEIPTLRDPCLARHIGAKLMSPLVAR